MADALQVASLALTALLALAVLFMLMRKDTKDDGADSVELRMQRALDQFSERVRESLTSTRQEVSQSKETMQKGFTDFNKLVTENLQHFGKSMVKVQETVGDLVKQQEAAKDLGEKLKDVLQAPKLRGNYGEQVLEELLRAHLPTQMWTLQEQIGAGRVDAAVHYQDMKFPVDSKFPRDDYRRYMDLEDEGARRVSWKAYTDAVRTQIRSISNKYISPEHGTSDFALMFIPSDGIYYQTVADSDEWNQRNPVPDEATKHNVVLVSPSTFGMFLQVLMAGAKNVQILKGARRIQERLQAVQMSYGKFVGNYEAMGKAIDRASDEHRKGSDNFRRLSERMVDVTALEVEDGPEASTPQQSPLLAD
jgi:DNA recombination protein RmuC